MPGLPQRSTFEHITISELHPTFGAEISGVDFSHPVEEKVFQEILTAMSKVGSTQLSKTNIRGQWSQPGGYSTVSACSAIPVSTMPVTLPLQRSLASWTM
jgi:hypothetical protein